MPLSLGVSKGERFYVGDTPVEVVDVQGFVFALLRVKGQLFSVDDTKSVEILPEVLVSCGKPSRDRVDKHAEVTKAYHSDRESQRKPPPELLPRLLIEAPRSITILRERLYVAGKK